MNERKSRDELAKELYPDFVYLKHVNSSCGESFGCYSSEPSKNYYKEYVSSEHLGSIIDKEINKNTRELQEKLSVALEAFAKIIAPCPIIESLLDERELEIADDVIEISQASTIRRREIAKEALAKLGEKC